MSKGQRRILVLLTLLLTVGCDQMTKELAKSHLPKTETVSIAGDVVRLDYAENRGAVLSFEYCLPHKWRGPALTVAVSALLGLLLGYLLLVAKHGPLSTMALSLVGGGTLSNLLDRVAFGGLVVDFLSVGWGPFRTAIFNVADIAIVAGTLLWGLSVIRSIGRSASCRATH